MSGHILQILAFLALGASSAQAAPTPKLRRDIVVVLDAGHGGTQDGCASADGGVLEKQLTLELSLRVREHLERAMPGARVVLTRDRDVTLTLADRVALANASEADLFVSIHANASPDRSQTGFETYVLDAGASSLDAARTARRENDDALLEPVEPAPAEAMVRQLELTANRVKAGHLARRIQSAYAERFPGRPDRGVRQAPFDVLMGVRMPAVLTEVGFLDHAQEGAWLAEPSHRDALADAITQAVVVYWREVERRQ
jgi:N-acetylmuramoyl-L-alanine amidase